ncbi:MAG TPA: tetratricopeptide repeat protein [Solimonas sp.]|nr:tetratricopeptide repeat protein [Solimonas sp.]
MQLLGLTALLLATCASAAERPVTASDRPFASTEANAQFHVMAGEMAANRRQPGIAAEEFLKALAITPDPELAERATQLALAARDEKLALQAAQVWLKIEPAALEAREVIARVALEQGDRTEVMTQAKAIIEGHAGGVEDGYRHVALLLSQAANERGPAAIEILRKLVEQQPTLAGAHHALALAALRFNDLPLAESAARKAMELSKNADQEVLLLVGALVRGGRLEESDALVDKLAGRSGDKAAAVRYGYSRLLLESDHRDAARNQLKKAVAADPKMEDARFALGVLAVSDREYADAEQYLKPLLEGPRAQEAALQLGRMEEGRKRWPEAMAYYGRVTTGMPALEALMRRAAVQAESGHLKEGLEALRQARSQLPPLAPRFYRAETELLMDHGRTEEALALLNEAVDEFPDDDELIYSRSLAFERNGQLPQAEKDLRKLLEQNPDDARALNGLGYMLLVNTSRVDEAAGLIRRAHELEPDDAAIIDSLGWAEYKRGRKQEALKYLQQAYDKFPDPEVAAHLGEVLWTLGEKDRARGIWDKALADDPEHRVLKETVQRLAR